jgi:hypothetical protein
MQGGDDEIGGSESGDSTYVEDDGGSLAEIDKDEKNKRASHILRSKIEGMAKLKNEITKARTLIHTAYDNLFDVETNRAAREQIRKCRMNVNPAPVVSARSNLSARRHRGSISIAIPMQNAVDGSRRNSITMARRQSIVDNPLPILTATESLFLMPHIQQGLHEAAASDSVFGASDLKLLGQIAGGKALWAAIRMNKKANTLASHLFPPSAKSS